MKPIVISKKEAIEVMEENLRKLKECKDTDTFLVLSHDLVSNKSLGARRLNEHSGRKLMDVSKTFVLNDDKEEDSVSVLSIYTERQMDILNIIPIGQKHDMILFPKLE